MISLRTLRVPCHRGEACASARQEARVQRSEDRRSHEEESSGGSTGPVKSLLPCGQARSGSGRLSLRACCLLAEGGAELVCLQLGARRTEEGEQSHREPGHSLQRDCGVRCQRAEGHRRSPIFSSLVTSKQILILQMLVCCTQWLPRLLSRQRVKGLWTTASCVSLNS